MRPPGGGDGIRAAARRKRMRRAGRSIGRGRIGSRSRERRAVRRSVDGTVPPPLAARPARAVPRTRSRRGGLRGARLARLARSGVARGGGLIRAVVVGRGRRDRPRGRAVDRRARPRRRGRAPGAGRAPGTNPKRRPERRARGDPAATGAPGPARADSRRAAISLLRGATRRPRAAPRRGRRPPRTSLGDTRRAVSARKSTPSRSRATRASTRRRAPSVTSTRAPLPASSRPERWLRDSSSNHASSASIRISRASVPDGSPLEEPVPSHPTRRRHYRRARPTNCRAPRARWRTGPRGRSEPFALLAPNIHGMR